MTSATGPFERAVARVNLDAVRSNCARLSEGPALCAVVKADGYGHGAKECALAAQDGGATWLAVTTAREAAGLRADGLEGPILVMGALTAEEAKVAIGAGADVVAWSSEFLAGLPRGAGRPRVHVKLDTGMGRLGARDSAEASRIAGEVASDDALELVGLMTHFATADELGDSLFPRQIESFTEWAHQVRALHGELVVHAANSAATLRDAAAHFDMVRCGVAIYGLDPFQRDPGEHSLEPALSLESYVARVARFEPGETAGYGRRWTAAEPTWVATVPIGYGDGWRRALSNNCDLLIGGRRHALVGTVSMDNVTVELGPETDVRTGDQVVLLGSQGEERILAEEVAERLDTINYEVVCGLSSRVPRRYEP
ncbi:MAG: alanine racemase [Thermoleophilaceae bacterium]|nr:alanine racemase [Thermoleophilaceae bacterium]